MKYKKSKYNIIIDKLENGNILLFNTFTCAFGVLQNNNVSFYNDIENVEVNNLDNEYKELIELMVKQGFIVEEDLDEFQLLKVREKLARYSSTRQRHLTIAPTLACNMACPYCFENKRDRKGMSDETKKILIKFIEGFIKDAEFFEVVWFGGEPLLELETIRQLSKEFIKICDKKQIEYKSSIVTNGILLDSKTATILESECKLTHAQITIDGLRNTHNKRRILKNGESSFDIIVNNIDSIKNKIPISIRVNVDKNNEKEVNKLIDFFVLEKKWGKDDKVRFYFGPIEKSTEECRISDSKCFNAIEFAELLKNVYEKLYNLGYTHCFDKLFSGNKIMSCGAITKNSLVIDAEGDIYTCWNALGFKEYCVGNVRKTLMLNGKWLQWLSLDYPDVCTKCEFLPMCQGSCAFKRLQNGNIPKCSFNKLSYKDLLKYIYKCS
ncbi:radical SAM/SPASM domain-containing protein [Hathewaya limosa]|uniref:Radical SAM core domain-containing protein n=1 Tax=Hathewaya limosa TaxID=1536 RepID=A0ABU0JWV7_HATLI|nr:SPASM domain-containing protein [Hathewaya limosa]MDQ0480940.1 uncharacterized protein [Hathewaya limosa]